MTKLYQHGVLTDLATVVEQAVKHDGLDDFRQLLSVNRSWTEARMLENEALALELKAEYSN